MILENYISLVLRNIDNACRDMSHQLEREITPMNVVSFEIPLVIESGGVGVKSHGPGVENGAHVKMSIYIGPQKLNN